jgi:parvulin-like peptidyl-prolyl isomerase
MWKRRVDRLSERSVSGGTSSSSRVVVPLLLIATFLATHGCIERREPREESAGAPMVALIDGEPLLADRFEVMLPEAETELTAEEKRHYLDEWITTELLYREALRRGLGPTPRITAQVERFEKELVADRLVQKVIAERAMVTRGEAMAYYKAHEKEYTQEFRVSHILVGTPEEAEKVLKLLKRRSFAWVARRYSLDRHTGPGGDLGFLSKGNMIPAFEKVVFDMKVGEIRGPIESEFGYHIVKLTAVRKARHPLNFEDVQEEIIDQLMLEKRKAVYDSLVAAVRAKAKIDILDESLRSAVVDSDTTAVEVY